jgi:hypothetical protein
MAEVTWQLKINLHATWTTASRLRKAPIELKAIQRYLPASDLETLRILSVPDDPSSALTEPAPGLPRRPEPDPVGVQGRSSFVHRYNGVGMPLALQTSSLLLPRFSGLPERG